MFAVAQKRHFALYCGTKALRIQTTRASAGQSDFWPKENATIWHPELVMMICQLQAGCFNRRALDKLGTSSAAVLSRCRRITIVSWTDTTEGTIEIDYKRGLLSKLRYLKVIHDCCTGPC